MSQGDRDHIIRMMNVVKELMRSAEMKLTDPENNPYEQRDQDALSDFHVALLHIDEGVTHLAR